MEIYTRSSVYRDVFHGSSTKKKINKFISQPKVRLANKFTHIIELFLFLHSHVSLPYMRFMYECLRRNVWHAHWFIYLTIPMTRVVHLQNVKCKNTRNTHGSYEKRNRRPHERVYMLWQEKKTQNRCPTEFRRKVEVVKICIDVFFYCNNIL